MYEPHRSKRGRTNLASCIVAIVFLIFIVMVIIIVYFFVFKLKSPKIVVDAIQFPTFSVTVNFTFTFFQFVSVTNPNRDAFTHYDSSLQLAYSAIPVGFIFIPADRIDGGHMQHMPAKFSVQSFSLPSKFEILNPFGSIVGREARSPTATIPNLQEFHLSCRDVKVVNVNLPRPESYTCNYVGVFKIGESANLKGLSLTSSSITDKHLRRLLSKSRLEELRLDSCNNLEELVISSLSFQTFDLT